MDESLTSIIYDSAPVLIGVALGFIFSALWSMWWHGYQRKKRDEREIEVFKIKMRVELEHTIGYLISMKVFLNRYQEGVRRIEDPQEEQEAISWIKYPEIKRNFYVPESFALSYSNISRQIYKLEKHLLESNYGLSVLYKRLNEIQEQYTKNRENEEYTEITLLNYRATEKMVDRIIPYIEISTEVSFNILSFILEKDKETLREEAEKQLNRHIPTSNIKSYV